MEIVIFNRSTVVTPSDLLKWTIACVKQLREEACPSWNVAVPYVHFGTREEELLGDVWQVVLFDDSDQAGMLGFHDVTPLGNPYAKVFAKDTMRNGGDVSVTLSHELLELVWDPQCSLFRPSEDGYELAQEACDACENDTYELDGVKVSDFVLSAFFIESAHGPYDRLQLITRPFQTRPGGYQIRRKGDVIDQVFGDAYPAGKLASKAHPASRTARRIAGSGEGSA